MTPQRGPSAVTDASVVLNVLLGQPSVGFELVRGNAPLHAPAIIDLEVLSALRRLESSDVLTARRADDAVTDLADLGLERHDLPLLRAAAWSLRSWARISDACYLSLAGALGVPLATDDARLARAARARGYAVIAA